MATSIALSPYFAQFIREQIDSGRYNNVSEVVSAEVREEREQQMTLDALRAAVELGVNSGPGKEAQVVFGRLLEKYRQMAVNRQNEKRPDVERDRPKNRLHNDNTSDTTRVKNDGNNPLQN